MKKIEAERKPRITRDSLLTLEAYARTRNEYRAKVIAHKKDRTVHLGEHLTLLFEDELTIRYQIQEMLRIEKTFDEAGIQDELDAYNPLVPDGHNWKATLLVEYEDVDERKVALAKLKGIEDRVWVQVEGARARLRDCRRRSRARERRQDLVGPFRALRVDAGNDRGAVKYGVGVSIGVDHPAYTFTLPAISDATRRALVADLA